MKPSESIRIHKRTLAVLRKLAKKERRTIAEQIDIVLEKGLKEKQNGTEKAG